MNKQQTRQIVQSMLNAGYTENKIAMELDLTIGYIRKVKCELGLTKTRRDPRDETDVMIELYQQGYTRAEIADKLGWSIGTVGIILRENGYGIYNSQENLTPVIVTKPKKREPVRIVDRTGKTWLDDTERYNNWEGDSIWNM